MNQAVTLEQRGGDVTESTRTSSFPAMVRKIPHTLHRTPWQRLSQRSNNFIAILSSLGTRRRPYRRGPPNATRIRNIRKSVGPRRQINQRNGISPPSIHEKRGQCCQTS